MYEVKKVKTDAHRNATASISDLAEVYLLTLAKSSKSDNWMVANSLTMVKFSLLIRTTMY